MDSPAIARPLSADRPWHLERARVNGLSLEEAAQRDWQARLRVTGSVQYHVDTGALEPWVDPACSQLETLP